MKIYRVGGSVRDALLGLPIADIDHVVVGSTVEEMLSLGFRPVGKDFPVFLHPTTHQEYALARRERKSGVGYGGFQFFTDSSVTLEEDLSRRDFTVNAMALDEEGRLVDPFGGLKDLQDRCFRHVSDAFVEDPLRILRLARFLARFDDFSVAAETEEIIDKMVVSGEVLFLTAERRLEEFQKGLGCDRADRMIRFLLDHRVLKQALGVEKGISLAVESLSDRALSLFFAKETLSGLCDFSPQDNIDIRLYRWGLLLFSSDPAMPMVFPALPLSTELKSLLTLFSELFSKVDQVFEEDSPERLYDLWQRLDAKRRPARCMVWVSWMEAYHRLFGSVLCWSFFKPLLCEMFHHFSALSFSDLSHLPSSERAAKRRETGLSLCAGLLKKHEEVSRETK